MSTRGMRGILKDRPDAITFMRNKVRARLFDRKDEAKLRQQLEIFTLHPPNPDTPSIPWKDEYDKAKTAPVETLAKAYIRKHSSFQKKEKTVAEAEEERYRVLFEIPKKRVLGKKSTVVANAYEFALKQLEFQKLNPEVSEEDSFKAIEEILKREQRDERHRSREVRKAVVKDAKAKKEEAKKEEAKKEEAKKDEELGATPTEETPPPPNTIPSILNAKTVAQMQAWGDRLREVPYQRWSSGAVTALDHWIAIRILDLSEETWQSVLSGTPLTGEFPAGTAALHDVIRVREALFPETLQEKEEEDKAAELLYQEQHDETIDDLLRDLSGGLDEDDDMWQFDDEDEDEVMNDGAKKEERAYELTQELQTWRERARRGPFETWSDEERAQFDTWLLDYININTTPHERTQIDIESTRTQLLSQLPIYPSQNQSFWSKLSDETQIELLLDSILKSGPPPPSSSPEQERNREEYIQFLNLPYQEQREKLLTLSALRPIYDEYQTETDWLAFWNRHRELLMEGIELETLVPDPEGNITFGDIAGDEDVRPDERFKIERVKYTGDKERKEEILKAWMFYKTRKALVEEDLFLEGKIDLEGKEIKKDRDDY